MRQTIKGIGKIERDHSALTIGILSRGSSMDGMSKKTTSKTGFSKAILVIKKETVRLKEGRKLFSDDGIHCLRNE